ncbi:molybdate ABC transporter permease subunit [Paracrocinitomix mangrovi]|uniref:molybdate ABC transporter permease subunit n=1 Tax=Paracrocinitomix mangrovi TaxID=2862509 RepID=UPI001C8EB954|nr:molybdate ABC transporter permease subunit [Paracrocinitomix mangrovi]UKN00584.1 molybdate ABC transporter permease subunit [Paracrocinitomix mangrovi]
MLDFTPFYITFKLALFTVLILLIIGIPLAYFISMKKWKGKVLVESILMLPIVLPPTVLGFYFLTFLGKNSAFGGFLYRNFNIELAFTFNGILLGSVIFCLPFMLNPIIAGFRGIPANTIESVKMLRKSAWKALFKVYIPYVKRSIWTAILLTFAHTIGEFGVVLMIGGKMEETRVASVAIYDEMNRTNFDAANQYALILLGISFVLIVVLNLVSKNKHNIA